MKKNELTQAAMLAEAVGIVAGLVYVGLQIYYGIAYHANLITVFMNVAVLLLVYAGLTSEKNGGTHISIDDLAIYRNMPRFQVFDPGDANEFEAILRYAASCEGPVYIRSNKGKFPTFTSEGRTFQPGKAVLLNEGKEIGLITTGITTIEGIQASEELEKEGISLRHIHMPSIKPIDMDAIVETAKKTKLIVTVENHTIYGGLGSAVAEVLCENYPARLVRLGLQDHFGETAQLHYMMHKYGMDKDAIVSKIREIVAEL